MYPESKLGIESLLSRGDSRAKKKYSLFCNSCGCDHDATKLQIQPKPQQPSGLFSSSLKCKEDFQ